MSSEGGEGAGPARTGAQHLAHALAGAGIGHVFSLSGNQIMPVYDACLDAGIAITHVRHEAAAVYMAEAWAQVSGTPGVALVTAGAGFANALGALPAVRASETPVILLSGDSPRDRDGQGAFQELDQTAASRAFVKEARRAGSAARVAADLSELAAAAMAARPGPVHLALPFDVLTSAARAEPVSARAEPGAPDPGALPERLKRADRPVILTGPALNALRAGALRARLGRALGAPVLTIESPRGLNDPALRNLRGVLGEADLVLSLGKSIDYALAFGDCAGGADWAVVDAETAELERARAALGARLALAVQAPPRAFAEALAEAAGAPAHGSDWREAAERRLAELPPVPPAAGGAITSDTLCRAVARRLAGRADAIAVCDGGEFGQWAQAHVRVERRIINGLAGAIGGSLCHAIGAKRAAPEACVYALLGDGTAGFHLAEFETAARCGLPFVAVIGNDRRWNAEHQIQLRDYGADRLIGCELSDARYDLAAAALGGHGEFVTAPEELDAALERAEASGKPACVNVIIEGLSAPGGQAK